MTTAQKSIEMQMETILKGLKPKEDNLCEFCGGTGKIEIEMSYIDEDSHQRITEGTGRFKKCFNCNQ